MHRSTRRIGHAKRERTVTRRGDIRTADHRMIGRKIGPGQIAQPIGIGPRIVVDIGDDLAGCPFGPQGARGAQSAIRRADHGHVVFRGNGRAGIGRAIVDQNHLEIRIVELGQPGKAIMQRAGAVVGAHHHGDARPGDIRRKRTPIRSMIEPPPAPVWARAHASPDPKSQSSISVPPRYHSSVQA